MMRLLIVVLRWPSRHQRRPCHLRSSISQTAWSLKSAKHAVPVFTWSMVPACVPPSAVTPPDVQLECARLVAAASNEAPKDQMLQAR